MVKWRTLVPQNHRYGKSCWSWFAERFCSAESFFKCHHFNLGTIWICGKNWMWRNKWRGDLLEKLPQGHFTTCNWKCNGSKLPSSESTSVDCESDLFPKSSTGYMCVCVCVMKETYYYPQYPWKLTVEWSCPAWQWLPCSSWVCSHIWICAWFAPILDMFLGLPIASNWNRLLYSSWYHKGRQFQDVNGYHFKR